MRHVLAALPTGYGKPLTGLPVAAKHLGISVPWWKNRFNHSCCLAIFCPDGRPAFGFEEGGGQSTAILTSVRIAVRDPGETSVRGSGERADESELDYFGRHGRGRCSCRTCKHLVCTPRSSCKQQNFRELLLSKLYQKAVVCVVANEA